MGGAMYVEVMVPKQIRSPYPVVFLHGAGQTGVDWLQTPDGRPGWAYNFLDMGYVVYLQDFPARGRSQYVPGVDGTAGQLNLNIRTAHEPRGDVHRVGARAAISRRRRSTRSGRAPAASATRSSTTSTRRRCSSSRGTRQETLTRDANVALLDMIGTPVILLTHSQGGAFGWLIADARPNLVKAIVTARAGGAADQGRRHREGRPTTSGGGLSWGVSEQPDHLRAGGCRRRRSCRRSSTSKPEPGKVPCYVQTGAGAQAEEPAEHSRAVPERRGRLSPRLRSLPGEVAEPGRREDRVRRDGEGRAWRATGT